MEAVTQMELFPSVTKEEIKYVRRQLKKYPEMGHKIAIIEQKEFP